MDALHKSALRLPQRRSGFTLLELLVVVAIIAIASAGVTLALRDTTQTRLERDAVRLAALLESARAQSRSSGVPVRWRALGQGFVFDGLPPNALPSAWLSEDTRAASAEPVLLGPEPVITAQAITLLSRDDPQRTLLVVSDGVRPFTVQGAATAAAPR